MQSCTTGLKTSRSDACLLSEFLLVHKLWRWSNWVQWFLSTRRAVLQRPGPVNSVSCGEAKLLGRIMGGGSETGKTGNLRSHLFLCSLPVRPLFIFYCTLIFSHAIFLYFSLLCCLSCFLLIPSLAYSRGKAVQESLSFHLFNSRQPF